MEIEEIAPASDEAIHLAFDLPHESAVDRLLRLGQYDLWRGNLSAMRGDVPPRPAEPSEPPTAENIASAERLYEAIFMKKAFDYLQAACVDVLRLRYAEGKDIDAIAAHVGTTTRYAEKLVSNCRKRLYEIVDKVRSTASEERPSGILTNESDADEVRSGKFER